MHFSEEVILCKREKLNGFNILWNSPLFVNEAFMQV